MPRKKINPNSPFPYHVCVRSQNREWFGLELKELWPLMTDYLYLVQKVYGLQIISFVLMNNHFHLLVCAPHGNLSEAMNYFMRETSKLIGRRTKRINHIYGGRFHRTLVDNQRYFLCVYKYVYRNPVEVGRCQKVEEYPFSTLHGLLGFEHLMLPLEEDRTLFDSGVEETLAWLNRAPLAASREDIRCALRGRHFKLSKKRWKNKKNPLEEMPY